MISYKETQKHKGLDSFFSKIANKIVEDIDKEQNTNTEETKMAYNAQKSEELKGSTLPADQILVGIITDIQDGVSKDFVAESAKSTWKGDLDSPAINVIVEVKPNPEEDPVKIHQMYTYIDEDGTTKYTKGSNLGKYHKKYGKLPEAGDQVKVETNGDGFGKIKLN